MINIRDKKGKPLGLEYDYEYRGMNRERNRDSSMYRFFALWAIFGALFALGGIVALVKYFIGTTDSTFGQVLFVSLITFGIAGFCFWMIANAYRKHKRLLEAIGHAPGRR